MPNGNHLFILQRLRKAGALTRRHLAQDMGVSVSMVSKLTSDLQARGLIREAGRSAPLGGRPSDLLSLEPKAAYALGLDIGGNHQRAILTNLIGEVVARVENEADLPNSREGILQRIERLVRQLLSTPEVDSRRVVGLGAGLWGSVDPETGVVYSWTETPALSLTWKNFALRDALQEHFSFAHIRVDDIVRTMGLAEVLYGSGATRDQDFIFALADTGVGVAVMIGGVPYVGPSQLAGEIGHIPVAGGTLPCNCGNTGCLETMASTRAVLEQAQRRLAESSVLSTLRDHPGSLTVQAMIAAAESGDKLAYQILTEAGEKLGIGLAIAVNLLGPRLVVIGGALAGSNIYLEAARRMVRLQALGKVSSGLTIVASRLNHLAGARGAASQVLNMLFLPGENNLLSL